MRRRDLREVEHRGVVDDDEGFHAALAVHAGRRPAQRGRLDAEAVDGVLRIRAATRHDLQPVLAFVEAGREAIPVVVVRAPLTVGGP